MEEFRSLKVNKAPGLDQIDVTVINQIYKHMKIPLIRGFGDSIKLGVFRVKLNLTYVNPLFRSGKNELLTNYRPISVLPCFSEILERIMYSRIYEYLTKDNLLFDKQFGFRKRHSTEYAQKELVNRVYDYKLVILI